MTTLASAAEPPNQNDPCSKAGRNSCSTNGVGQYRNYRYGVRWFGDYRKAVGGVDDPLFCIDLRFWYPSSSFDYERRSAAGLDNRDGKPVRAVDLRRMAYALWRGGESRSNRTSQAAMMLYVHGLMGDAEPGEVAPGAIGAVVERRYEQIARNAAKYAGPYTLELKASPGLIVGTAAKLTARVLSASGAAVPDVTVKLDGRGVDGLTESVRTGAGGSATARFTPTRADGLKLSGKAQVAATLPALYVPTKGEAARSGQRLVGLAEATVSDAVTADAKVAPKVRTQVSAQSVVPGSAITDSVTVEGLSGQAVTVNAALYGPFPAADKTVCDATPVWQGSFSAPADGTYVTDPVTLQTPGYYTYVEWIDEGENVSAVRTACGEPAETTAVRGAPAVTTQISAQQSAPGTAISDTLVVTGLGALTGTVNVELWGPYASKDAIDCQGTPLWTGTVAANGDGTYKTAETTLPAAGYYTYRETLAETPAYAAARTECGEVAETTLAKAAPEVTTVVSSKVVRPGSELFDNIKVSGLGKTPATIEVRLYGPFASRGAIDCSGAAYWKGKVQATGDGDYASPRAVVRRAGFYTYVENIEGSELVAATRTKCAEEAETSLAAPLILTGWGESKASRPPRAAASDVIRPTRVELARVGIRASIVSSAIDLSDGALSIPKNIDRVGWWRDGAAPGDGSGTILLAGHVDSATAGAGAFYGLKSARIGDTITLSSDDGKTRRYRVTLLRRMPKTQLPTGIFTRTGEKRLVLVTCGGPFNQSTGHYRDNIVVTATPI